MPALNFLCNPKPLSFFNCVELNKIELFLMQTQFSRIINLYTTRTSKCLRLDKELGVSRGQLTKTQVMFAVCVLHSALSSTLSLSGEPYTDMIRTLSDIRFCACYKIRKSDSDQK